MMRIHLVSSEADGPILPFPNRQITLKLLGFQTSQEPSLPLVRKLAGVAPIKQNSGALSGSGKMIFSDGKHSVTITKLQTRYGERWHITGAFQGTKGRWASDAQIQREIKHWEANGIHKVSELA